MTRPGVLLARWVEAGLMRELLIASPDDALDLFDRVNESVTRAPTMITFSPIGSNQELAIGAGQPQSLLTFQNALDPPYYRSRGDADRQGDVWFLYAGENTQFRARESVPSESARRALDEYLSTGRLPTAISWDEI